MARSKAAQKIEAPNIESYSHDLRGVAKIDGKTTFIDGALPGESVVFIKTRQKKDYDEGFVDEILKKSATRVTPKCKHFNVCGGCKVQHIKSDEQINAKQQIMLTQLKNIGKVKPVIILDNLSADIWNYRSKARLSVRYVEKKQKVLVGFREKNNSRFIADIDSCEILEKDIAENLTKLSELIGSFSEPRAIAQVEVACGDDKTALIFRNLKDLSWEDENYLREFAVDTGFIIYTQPGGPQSITKFYPDVGDDYLVLNNEDFQIQYKFHPSDFTQVNKSLNKLMVKKAIELLELKTTDKVLDLFSGLGNFSLPIAKHSAFVHGVEGSSEMVTRAEMNAKLNDIKNTKFTSANLDDAVSINALSVTQCNKLLLDPPRAGAMTLANKIDNFNFSHIVYVSCNPATLARDADILVNKKGYKLKGAGVMDMFPHTAHVESIALFIRE